MTTRLETLETLDAESVAASDIASHMQSGDLVLVHASLSCLERQLARHLSATRRAELIGIVPDKLAGLTYECQNLVVKLWRHVPLSEPIPEFDVADVPREIAIEWAITRLLRDPEAVVSDEQILFEALSSLDWKRVSDPEKLFHRLADSQNPGLQLLLVQLIADAGVDGMISPDQARQYFIRMLHCHADAIVLAALQQLAQPWLSDDCPTTELVRLINEHQSTSVVLAALDTLAHWPSREFLLQRAREEWRPRIRSHALMQLAKWANDEDIDFILDAALVGDLHGDCLDEVIQFQRLGGRLTRASIQKLFSLSLTATHIKPESWAELIGQHWGYWLQLLESLACDDPNWPQQIKIVCKLPRSCSLSAKQKSKPNRVHERVFEFLISKLNGPDFKPQFPLLATSTSRLAITANQRYQVESRLLELLEEIPDAAFEGLRRVGSDDTEQIMLRRAIDEISIPISQQQAKQWLLSTGRHADANYFLGDAGEWPPQMLKYLCATIEPLLLQQLCQILQTPSHPAHGEAIRRMAELSDHGGLASLGPLLLSDDEDDREVVSAAIKQIGSRLYSAHRIRPTCLIDATNAVHAGEFVLADTLLDLIDNATTDDELLGLLTQLVGLPHPDLSIRLNHLRFHENEHVVKLVIEGTTRSANPLDAIWLHDFAIGESHFLARQAINTLGALNAKWAGGDLIRALHHPNMNIKKSAAVALQTAGTVQAVGPIVSFLRTHDNPGFRSELSEALDAIIGKQQKRCLILSELQLASGREIGLLLEVIDRQIPIGTIVFTLKECQKSKTPVPPWLEVLLKGVVSGQYHLRNGSVDELKRTLSQQGLLTGELKYAFGLPKSDIAPTSQALAQRSPHSTTTDPVRQLRSHFDQVLTELTGTEPTEREAAMKLIEQQSGNLHTSEKAALADCLRTVIDQQALPADRTLTALNRCQGVVTKDVAALAWRMSENTKQTPEDQRVWALKAMIQAVGPKSIAVEELTSILRRVKESRSQNAAIQFGLNQGWHAELLADAPHWRATAVEHLMHCWHWNPPSASQLIEAIQTPTGNDDARSVLFEWLIESPDPATEDWLLSQIGKRRPQFLNPSRYFQSQWHHSTAERVAKKLRANDKKVRVEAAQILLNSSSQFRQPVLEAFLDERLGEHPPLRVSINELLDWPKFSASVDQRRLSLLSGATGSVERKIDLSLSFYRQLCSLSGADKDDENLAIQLRSIMRSYPVSALLAAIEPAIENGEWVYLELLGSTNYVPPQIVDRLRTGDTQSLINWLEVLHRWAAISLIGESGLAEVLIEVAAAPSAVASDQSVSVSCRAITLCGRLARWTEQTAAQNLLDQLVPFLHHSDQRAITAEAAILSGIGSAPSHIQPQLLMSIDGLENRPVIIQHVADVYLERPSILDNASSSVVEAVRGFMIQLTTDRDPHRARLALRRLVDNQEDSTEQILIESLQHTDSSVRAYAHRLLRQTVSKERYFEATMALLEDRVPEFRRSAIRVLSFGKYEPAIRKIVPLLHDTKKHVDRTAREALILYGLPAASVLRQFLQRTRPDRRDKLLEVIAAIEDDRQQPH